MKLIITRHAFERYLDRQRHVSMTSITFKIDCRRYREKIFFLEWKGKPAVYFDQTYWRYERDEKTDTLITKEMQDESTCVI